MLNLAPRHDYNIFYNRAEEVFPQAPLNRLRHITIPTGDKPWRLSVMLAHILRRPQDCIFPSTDLFHATDNLLPYFTHTPGLFTLFDLTHHFFPQTQSRLNHIYLTLMLHRFLKAAHTIIAISENTRREAIHLYNIHPDKIVSIPLGVNPNFRLINSEKLSAIRKKYRLPKKFLLAVGTIEPRKNLTILLQALAENKELSLVIAGKRGWLADTFFRQLQTLGCESRVTLLGYTDEEDLPALYNAASLFVFPSLYEGFGLPVLEAMACGTPVVCADSPSLLEVAGVSSTGSSEPAAILARSNNPQAFQQAITRLWNNDALCAELRDRGLKHAARFTWERTALKTLDIYKQFSSNQQL